MWWSRTIAFQKSESGWKGYQSFSTASRTLQGIEAMHMIRKGRVRWVGKADPLAQLRFIGELFGADDLTLAISAGSRRSAFSKFSQRYPRMT
jgi:hypothetical protein